MPDIRSSTDLRNSYNEISALCHERSEPIFITKNGRGDLAVMSIEAYDQITGRDALYRLLDAARIQRERGEVVSLEDAFGAVEAEIAGHAIQS
jgi:prevent-host-death family protein